MRSIISPCTQKAHEGGRSGAGLESAALRLRETARLVWQELYLTFYEHGHIHKHVVQLSDASFQFDDLIVPCLDLI